MTPCTLVSWAGVSDYRHAFEDASGSPLNSVMAETKPDRVLVLWGAGKKTPVAQANDYAAWLRSRAAGQSIPIPKIEVIELPDADDRVMDFEWVYGNVEGALRNLPTEERLVINASSGTSIMTAAWIVYAKTVGGLECTLYVSSPERGVQQLQLPPGLRIDRRRILAMTDDDPLLDSYIKGDLWEHSSSFEHLVGQSRAIHRLKYQAEAVARYSIPVLITGAPGTGKSLVAEAIHDASQRSGQFVTVDCGQLYSETEIHSVFGWKKGAFTGASSDNDGLIDTAKGGSLFLDEIGNAQPAIQSGLLRLLQTGKYRPLGSSTESESSARLIAATNTDLDNAVREGQFRQDLLDRLRVVQIQIPPLKDRGEDIVLLAHSKLNEFQDNHNETMQSADVKEKHLSADAEKALQDYDWPGNVRELEHLVARLVIFSAPEVQAITAHEIQKQLLTTGDQRHDDILNRKLEDGFDLEHVIRKVQWHYVLRAAADANGNKTEIARLLGYGDSRTPLKTMLKNFKDCGLPDPLSMNE